MLQQEQRKLQDDDMRKVHERTKRLANRKKMEIIDREVKAQQTVDEVKKREQRLVDFRYRNRVMFMQQSDKYAKSLDSWAAKGFNNNMLPDEQKQMMIALDRQMGSQKQKQE